MPGDNSVVMSQRSLITPPGEWPHLQPGSDSAPLRRPCVFFLPDMWMVQQNSSFVEVETDSIDWKIWLKKKKKIQWRRDQEGSNPLWTSTQVNPVHFTVHSYWRFSTGQSLSKLLSISKVQLWGELKRKTLTIYQCNFGHWLTTKCKNMLEHIDHTAAVFYITFFFLLNKL